MKCYTGYLWSFTFVCLHINLFSVQVGGLQQTSNNLSLIVILILIVLRVRGLKKTKQKKQTNNPKTSSCTVCDIDMNDNSNHVAC